MVLFALLSVTVLLKGENLVVDVHALLVLRVFLEGFGSAFELTLDSLMQGE